MTSLARRQLEADQKMAQAASQALLAMTLPFVSLPQWGEVNVQRHAETPKR